MTHDGAGRHNAQHNCCVSVQTQCSAQLLCVSAVPVSTSSQLLQSQRAPIFPLSATLSAPAPHPPLPTLLNSCTLSLHITRSAAALNM